VAKQASGWVLVYEAPPGTWYIFSPPLLMLPLIGWLAGQSTTLAGGTEFGKLACDVAVEVGGRGVFVGFAVALGFAVELGSVVGVEVGFLVGGGGAVGTSVGVGGTGVQVAGASVLVDDGSTGVSVGRSVGVGSGLSVEGSTVAVVGTSFDASVCVAGTRDGCADGTEVPASSWSVAVPS
jgi:hypothetical protein